MSLKLRFVFTSFAFCVLLGSSAAIGETVLKLSLASTGSDIAMAQSGSDFFIGTTSDGIAGTTGDQNTAIDYTGFLDPLFSDVTTNTASLTISGLKRTGSPNSIGGTVVVQDFFGGTFNLYDPSNGLLLSGNLQESTLTGVLGGIGTGSIFTTKVGTFTNGSLLSNLQANSLNVSMALTNVKNAGGDGFLVSGSPFSLQPFTADASVNISANQSGVPEPASVAIALFGAMGLGFMRRRRA